MEKITICSKNFVNEYHTVYQLQYSLLIQSTEQGSIYGIEIIRTDDTGIAETECAEGLCESREKTEQFLHRLAEGLALPTELLSLCDDFISEMEMGEKQIPEQEAC